MSKDKIKNKKEKITDAGKEEVNYGNGRDVAEYGTGEGKAEYGISRGKGKGRGLSGGGVDTEYGTSGGKM
jgi:hypothetical protein